MKFPYLSARHNAYERGAGEGGRAREREMERENFYSYTSVGLFGLLFRRVFNISFLPLYLFFLSLSFFSFLFFKLNPLILMYIKVPPPPGAQGYLGTADRYLPHNNKIIASEPAHRARPPETDGGNPRDKSLGGNPRSPGG